MEEEKVSYYTYEATQARLERFNVRLWILNIILLAALILSNLGWMYYENQFEDVTIQQEASSEGGGNAFVNSGGDFNYGESKADN